MSTLRDKIIKLGKEQPQLRKHLGPILRETKVAGRTPAANHLEFALEKFQNSLSDLLEENGSGRKNAAKIVGISAKGLMVQYWIGPMDQENADNISRLIFGRGFYTIRPNRAGNGSWLGEGTVPLIGY